MLDEQKLIEEVEQKGLDIFPGDVFLIIALIEIRESIDRYIGQRIESDKVFEGVLKDIYNAVQGLETKK